MKYKSIYKTVTALMLTIASVQSVLAGPGWVTQQNDDRVEEQHSAAHITLNKKPIITKEDKWWNDYESSGSKNSAQYVHDLSKSNPEAAAWFLLTGGKNGFANRQATDEEEKLLLGAMKIISSNLDKNQKIIEYCVSEIGKFHLDLMYKQFDQIASIVQKLNLQGIKNESLMEAKKSASLSLIKNYSQRQVEDAFEKANRFSEYSLFSDNLKKGILGIGACVEDKYDSDYKLVEDKYDSYYKLVEDKYDSDYKLAEHKYSIDVSRRIKSGNLDTFDLFRKKETKTLDLFRKKEAKTLDLFRKKEAKTLDLFRKKEAIIEEISKASYFGLVNLVNHYYPNSI